MNAKLDNLINWFNDKGRVFVALSGGVDSALVAYAAYKKLQDSAIAVTADYKTLSTEELESARQTCREIGINHLLLDYNELENVKFVNNDYNRCFHCRTELGSHLQNLAEKHNITTIVDGTNMDDLGDYRPGIDAMKKHGIKSPLVETGFTKNDVRTSAKSIGLSIYDKPSNSCLASRIPWGQKITTEKLTRIEYAETIIKQVTGIRHVRVRDFNIYAKVEVDKQNIAKFNQEILDEISSKFRLIGYSGVEIDPDGYVPGKINVM